MLNRKRSHLANRCPYATGVKTRHQGNNRTLNLLLHPQKIVLEAKCFSSSMGLSMWNLRTSSANLAQWCGLNDWLGYLAKCYISLLTLLLCARNPFAFQRQYKLYIKFYLNPASDSSFGFSYALLQSSNQIMPPIKGWKSVAIRWLRIGILKPIVTD